MGDAHEAPDGSDQGEHRMTNGTFRETERRHPRWGASIPSVSQDQGPRLTPRDAFGGPMSGVPRSERPSIDFNDAPMDFGNRAPRLVPRGAPVVPIRERPIGLKDTDAPRPWTLRRVFGMLFLPRR